MQKVIERRHGRPDLAVLRIQAHLFLSAESVRPRLSMYLPQRARNALRSFAWHRHLHGKPAKSFQPSQARERCLSHRSSYGLVFLALVFLVQTRLDIRCMFNVLRTNWGSTDRVLFMQIQLVKILLLCETAPNKTTTSIWCTTSKHSALHSLSQPMQGQTLLLKLLDFCWWVLMLSKLDLLNPCSPGWR